VPIYLMVVSQGTRHISSVSVPQGLFKFIETNPGLVMPPKWTTPAASCSSARKRRYGMGCNYPFLTGLAEQVPRCFCCYLQRTISEGHFYCYNRIIIVICQSAMFANPIFAAGASARQLRPLIGVRINADPFVRRAVAHGLGFTSRPDAIETPIELMADVADDVRDWATFGLGQSTGDSPQIWDAFRRHPNDAFLDVRQEALWGLARRKDPQGLRGCWRYA
jgi:hypothetical protein